MKLWYSSASPFARKAMVTALEKGIADQIEKITVSTNVTASDANLRVVNPAGKVPSLVLDDGSVIFDSAVICAYLNEIGNGPELTPTQTQAKYRAKTLEALADAIMDAAVGARYETALRPAELQWKDWYEGLILKVETSIDSLEKDWKTDLEGALSIGAIATGCALGYLDFRFPQLNWRDSHPSVAKWFEKFAERPAMRATVPSV